MEIIKSMNRTKEDIKSTLQCIIEMEKDYFLKLQDLSLPSTNYEDSYGNEDSCIDKDNMSSEEYPSDFEEWLKKSRKKLRYKGKLKLHSDQQS